MTVITAEEQAAIDAFMANKEITKIPTGKSHHSGWKWSEEEGKLVLVDQDDNTYGKKNWTPGRKITPETAQRRMRLREHMDNLGGAAEFAEAEGVEMFTVYKDAQAIGRTFKYVTAQRKLVEGPKPKKKRVYKPRPSRAKPKSVPRKVKPEVQARRAKVKELIGQSLSRAAIAKALGVSRKTVSNDAAALGMLINPEMAARLSGERIEARRAKVKELLLAGYSRDEIAKACGVSRQPIGEDIKALGLIGLASTKQLKKRRIHDAINASEAKTEQAVAKLDCGEELHVIIARNPHGKIVGISIAEGADA